MTAPREPFFPQHRAIRVSDQPVTVRNLGTVEYQEAWDLQVQLAEQRARDACEDTFLVVEHPSIYTAGKITQAQDLPRNSLPVINVDRGGRITWHGAGQLVVYPIIKLAEPIDVVEYVRRLELATVQTVRTLGLSSAGRIDGRSGVWVPASVSPAAPGAPAGDRKLAAIGIRVSRGVTSHGLALNCNNTLDYYTHITPCGISDAGVSTLSLELGQDVSPDEVHSELISNLSQALAGKLDVPNAVVGQASNPTKISKTATKMGAVKAADPKS